MVSFLFPINQTQGKVICVGPRELLITGIHGVVTILLILASIVNLVKVGLIVAVLGVGILLAYGRLLSCGDTIETAIRRAWQRRFNQRPNSPVHNSSVLNPKNDLRSEGHHSRWIDYEKVLKHGQAGSRIWVTPLPLTWESLLWVVCSSVLIMSLVWIWTGKL